MENVYLLKGMPMNSDVYVGIGPLNVRDLCHFNTSGVVLFISVWQNMDGNTYIELLILLLFRIVMHVGTYKF